MNETTIICSKCRSRMEPGFVVDYTYGGKMQSRWIEGEPESSFWSGLQTKGKLNFNVSTYRCEGCGYLESYATEKSPEDSVFS